MAFHDKSKQFISITIHVRKEFRLSLCVHNNRPRISTVNAHICTFLRSLNRQDTLYMRKDVVQIVRNCTRPYSSHNTGTVGNV